MKQGSTLIEVIVAIGIVSLVMITLVSLVAVSVRNTALANERAVATKYAQEGMEFFRREKDFLGWETFLSDIQAKGSMCVPSIPSNPTTAFSTLPSGVCTSQYVDAKNIFQRSAMIKVVPAAGGSQVDTTVTISWSDNGVSQTSSLYETFQNTD